MDIRDFLGAEFYYRPLGVARPPVSRYRVVRARYSAGVLSFEVLEPSGNVLPLRDALTYLAITREGRIVWCGAEPKIQTFLNERKSRDRNRTEHPDR